MKESCTIPLVTVVTPSYNQGTFIEETILSVLNQDYPYIEYIIIDGGSSDNTLDIIRKYKNRLTWVSETDRGQSHAINKGFRMAKGEILCWLNSDDTYEPGTVRKAVECFLQNPGTNMVYGLVKIISESGEVTETTSATKPYDLWSVIHFGQIIYQASTFFLKDAFEHAGELNEDLNWCMDWDLWIRIGMRYEVINVDHVFANIRMYHSTKTSTGGFKRVKEIVKVMRQYSSCSVVFGIARASLGSFHTLLKYRTPFLYRLLKGLIFFVKDRSLNRFYENFKGVYSDGWLGRKAHFMFPVHADASAIRFSLSFPPELSTQQGTVTAIINGKRFQQFVLPASTSYELLLPYDRQLPKPTEVELIFSRFYPADDQRRKRACMLEDLSLVASSQDEN